MTFRVKRPDGKRTVENAEVGVNPTHPLLNLMEDIVLPEIDEKQITWQNLMETVVSDRLEEDEGPTIEVGYGPSPMNFIIQQDISLLKAVQRLSRQSPQQHYRREYEVDWSNIPIITAEDIISGVDMAVESSDESHVMEMYRGHIILAFGISEEYMNIARDAFMIRLNSMFACGLCTPSRNQIITGGE